MLWWIGCEVSLMVGFAEQPPSTGSPGALLGLSAWPQLLLWLC